MVNASKTGPAITGYCSADLSASRCGRSVGSRGLGRATNGVAGCARPCATSVCADRRPSPRPAGRPASCRTRPMTWATSSQPTQPASCRAYSSRSVGSLIFATIGTQRRRAEHPALGAVQVVVGQRGANRELEQRGSTRHQVAQCAVAGLEPQVAGIHPVVGDRNERLPREVLLPLERLDGRRASRRIAVEHVDQLTAKEVVVHHESPQHRQVLVAERRAARCDRRRHASQMHRHHVGVALDHHGLVPLGDIAFGQVQPEQHVRLLVQHRLGGVDVLGLHAVVVEQAARAESDHLARRHPDGPQQPPVEPVHRPAPALARQARRFEFLELETLAQQVFRQRVPARRGESAPELRGGVGVEVPLDEVLPRRRGLRRLQRLGVELLGRSVGGDQPAAAATVPLHVGGRRTGVGDGVADPIGEHLHRLHERDVFDLLQKRVHVTALAAAEAVEVAVIGTHVEGRRLLVVERAQTLERVDTGTAQLDVVADDVLDANPFTDGRDVAIGNPSSHRISLWAGYAGSSRSTRPSVYDAI